MSEVPMTQYEVRVYHSVLEAEYTFLVRAWTEQRARIATRELFSKELLDKRVLRVAVTQPGAEDIPPRTSWEPL